MYEDHCQHGYVPASCAECRQASSPAGEGPWGVEHYDAQHRGKTRQQLESRRAQCIARAAELGGYEHPSQAQRTEFDGLTAETIVIDDLIKRDDVIEARRSQIEAVRRAAMDPANCEYPAGDPRNEPKFGAAVVKGDRLETAQEVIQRAGNPWRDEGGPLDAETGAGYVSRAHAAIEAMAGRFPHDGAEKLAEMLSIRSSTFETTYEVRTEDDIKRSAELVLALSSPFYESAFRSILRYPESFRNGTGILMWSDQERLAYQDVMSVSRAVLIEDTGTGGQYLLPLVLDSQIMITNAGTANPWRRVCRNVTTSAKTWNGVTSTGVTGAGWLAEGATSSDNTPTLGALVIQPFKEAAWVMSSFEETADTQIAQQVPALLEDAFDRVEEAALVTGNGTSQPAGVITRATVDGNTGLVSLANAASVFPLLAALPPRFRIGDQAKPYWACNITILNLLRGVAPFAAATASIVNDQTADGIPEIFGYDVLESTTMDASNATGGHKNLLFFDAHSFIVCQRLGTTVVWEPLVASAGGILPSGVNGWFAYRRVGSDTPTATALRVHNNA